MLSFCAVQYIQSKSPLLGMDIGTDKTDIRQAQGHRFRLIQQTVYSWPEPISYREKEDIGREMEDSDSGLLLVKLLQEKCFDFIS